MKLSEKCEKIQGSVTLAIDAKAKAMRAQGEDVISFGAGEPDFDTPQYIIDAAIEALKTGKTKYTAAAGLPDLRQKVSEHVSKRLGIEVKPENVVISTGAKQALFNALQVLLNPGDEVLILKPYWVSYPELVKMADGVPVFVDTDEENNFALKLDKLERALTEKTKAIILNSPSNPSGVVFKESEIRAIGEFSQKNDLFIISDEIYDTLVYDGEKHFSVCTINEDIKNRTILINGMSKAYAMTGWRMGYSVCDAKIAKIMASYQSHATGNPNTITQYATLAALSNENTEFDKMYTEFDKRRKFAVKAVNEIEGACAAMPKGAFYVMVNIKKVFGKKYNGVKIENSMDFAQMLLEAEKTAVVPGGPFGAEGYIRLSYATSMENIEKGIARIKKFIEEDIC